METIVPMPDGLPLPAPVWLLRFLLLFTFVLHLVPMNFLLGGSILSVISRMKSGDANHARLAARITELLPIVIAFTVTLGVAPLLFVQVLYGQFLYSSSVLIGRWWLAVIPLLITAYYASYVLYFRKESASGYRPLLAWIAAILFVVIGFIYSNNMSLMLRLGAWGAHYKADPGGGGLNLGDMTLVPRYLHMAVGAVAVAGIWVMILGWRRRSGDDEWSEWAVRYGGKILVHATLLNVIVGLVYFVVLPRAVMMKFMGGDPAASGLFLVATILAILVLPLGYKGVLGRGDRKALGAAAILVFPLLILMILVRHVVRSATLEPWFGLADLQVTSDWGVFLMFAVTLVAGLAVTAWLVLVALRAGPKSPGS